jgi:hypothetical protein
MIMPKLNSILNDAGKKVLQEWLNFNDVKLNRFLDRERSIIINNGRIEFSCCDLSSPQTIRVMDIKFLNPVPSDDIKLLIANMAVAEPEESNMFKSFKQELLSHVDKLIEQAKARMEINIPNRQFYLLGILHCDPAFLIEIDRHADMIKKEIGNVAILRGSFPVGSVCNLETMKDHEYSTDHNSVISPFIFYNDSSLILTSVIITD